MDFSQEMIIKALLSKANENNDLLNLLLMSDDNVETGIRSIEGGVLYR